MRTHLCLFSVVGEVVQVEGPVQGVVVHLQRARLLTLFVKQESSSVGRAIVSQPRASVLQLLKAAQRGLKLPSSAACLAPVLFLFFKRKWKCPAVTIARKKRQVFFYSSCELSQRGPAEKSLKGLLWGVTFASGSWKQTANVLCSTEKQVFRRFKIKQTFFLVVPRLSAGARNCTELRIFPVFGQNDQEKCV